MKIKYVLEVSGFFLRAKLLRVLALSKVRQKSELSLMLASNYINMKGERSDILLVREVLCKNNYIKHRTGKALI